MLTQENVVRQQVLTFNSDLEGFLANCTPHVRLLRNGTLIAQSPEAVRHVLRHEQRRRLGRLGHLDGEAVMVAWDPNHPHKPTGYLHFESAGERISEVDIKDDPMMLERVLGIY